MKFREDPVRSLRLDATLWWEMEGSLRLLFGECVYVSMSPSLNTYKGLRQGIIAGITTGDGGIKRDIRSLVYSSYVYTYGLLSETARLCGQICDSAVILSWSSDSHRLSACCKQDFRQCTETLMVFVDYAGAFYGFGEGLGFKVAVWKSDQEAT